MVDISEAVRTKALAAASGHVPSFQEASKKERDYRKQLESKFHGDADVQARIWLQELEGAISRGNDTEARTVLERLQGVAKKNTLPQFNLDALERMDASLGAGELAAKRNEYLQQINRMDSELGDTSKAKPGTLNVFPVLPPEENQKVVTLSIARLEARERVEAAISGVLKESGLTSDRLAAEVYKMINNIEFPQQTKEPGTGVQQTPATEPQRTVGSGRY